MKHADSVIERILFLDGVPNMQRLNKVHVGETVAEQLQARPRAGARRRRRASTAASRLRVANGDNGTRELLDEILETEEEHIDWLETQLELISQVGEAQYLAQQLHD